MKIQNWRAPTTVSLFVMLLSVDVTVLLAEKIAARSAGQALGNESAFYWQLARTWWTWLGIGLGPLQLLLWSTILKRSDLSLAYCITSLGYPLTMVAAVLLLKEQLGWEAWLGAAFVTFGAALIGSDQKSNSEASSPLQTPIPESVGTRNEV
jgi:drug/metabolite transporter (DMT)-like permease